MTFFTEISLDIFAHAFFMTFHTKSWSWLGQKLGGLHDWGAIQQRPRQILLRSWHSWLVITNHDKFLQSFCWKSWKSWIAWPVMTNHRKRAAGCAGPTQTQNPTLSKTLFVSRKVMKVTKVIQSHGFLIILTVIEFATSYYQTPANAGSSFKHSSMTFHDNHEKVLKII